MLIEPKERKIAPTLKTDLPAKDHLPAERISQPTVDCLTMGRDAGMFQEDAADPE